MDDCRAPLAVSALACAIADTLNDEELNYIAAFFEVLGDQLALISAQRVLQSRKSCE